MGFCHFPLDTAPVGCLFTAGTTFRRSQLEKQVCSLELAKRLKELRVEQESLFSWFEVPGYKGSYDIVFHSDSASYMKKMAAAFTVAELGEMWKKWNIDEPLPHIGQNGWYWYRGETEIREKTEANARAKMLIHLIEKGLVKP